MGKFRVLIFFFLFAVVSCSKEKSAVDSVEVLNDDEKKIKDAYTQIVLQADLPKDSLLWYFQKLEVLQSKKPYFTALNELSKATYFRKEGAYLSAITHYEKALGGLPENDSATDYAFVGMGVCYRHLGNFPKALAWFQKSVEYGENQKDTSRLAGTYASLAQLHFEKEQENEARKYIEQVFQLQKNKEIGKPYFIALHTLANMEAKKGNYLIAMDLDRKGMILADKAGNDAVKITFQDNQARCYFNYLKDYDKAVFYFKQNLIIDKKLNNPTWIADTYINLAEVETARENYEKAHEYLQEAINIFSETQQFNNSLKAYAALKRIYEKQDNFKKALETNEIYLEKYKKHLNEESEKSFAEYNALFETKKKEKELSETQLQLREEELRSQRKNIWLLLLGSLIVITLGIVRYLQIKSRLKQKKLQLEISRELHDSLGSQLTLISSISDSLKNSAIILDESISKKINTLSEFSENTINELKNTIWVLNSSELKLHELKVKLLNFISQASEAQEKVKFHFSFDIQHDVQLNSKQAINLYRIFQEILNNAIKYSQAEDIFVVVEQAANHLYIKIRDNGIGFNWETEKNKSLGLANIQQRIMELGGQLGIETSAGKGTQFEITVKL